MNFFSVEHLLKMVSFKENYANSGIRYTIRSNFTRSVLWHSNNITLLTVPDSIKEYLDSVLHNKYINLAITL